MLKYPHAPALSGELKDHRNTSVAFSWQKKNLDSTVACDKPQTTHTP